MLSPQTAFIAIHRKSPRSRNGQFQKIFRMLEVFWDSYYRKFIYNFPQIAYPLTRLTQKNRHFEWTEESENAFNTLKRLLTESPVLSYPDIKETFILDTDATSDTSAYGVGAVLSQVQNGRETVIAYGSKTLSKSQRKYCTTYRELLAVVLLLRTSNITYMGNISSFAPIIRLCFGEKTFKNRRVC